MGVLGKLGVVVTACVHGVIWTTEDGSASLFCRPSTPIKHGVSYCL